jgi:hypothetical protein
MSVCQNYLAAATCQPACCPCYQALQLQQVPQAKRAPDAPAADRQLLAAQVVDRFGVLFTDYKGAPSTCLLYGPAKLVAMALSGLLIGLFVGECGVGALLPSRQPSGRWGAMAPGPALQPCRMCRACRSTQNNMHLGSPAGLAAHSQPSTAVVLLVLLLAVQVARLLMLVALRPYNSLLLHMTEAACCALDLAGLAVLTAAYSYSQGSGGGSGLSGRLQVGAQCTWAPLLTRCGNTALDLFCHPATPVLPQGLDSACAVLAAMSLLLQLFSALWSITGQLAAVEMLAVALLLPRRPLQGLHTLLARALVSLGGGLSKLGLVGSPLLMGEGHAWAAAANARAAGHACTGPPARDACLPHRRCPCQSSGACRSAAGEARVLLLLDPPPEDVGLPGAVEQRPAEPLDQVISWVWLCSG